MAMGQKFGGRVKGTPNKATAEIRQIAGRYGQEAVAMLVRLMRTAEDPKVKAMAANSLLDRAYGKPAQMITGDPEQPLAATLDGIDAFTQRIAALADRYAPERFADKPDQH
jgi:hypothetical protein